ncbi:uncharacterized protein YutE (UPF0331/DUF86 family) [Anoxybacillus voinovskiensis]|uniref:Uncharacterized protein YutE (UPF0331/DUF86 family) n=1 Tax=Anoxybacteroides voinovskiense TaxID=230470 RepID=A0A840E2N6_9BACL|nr:DUF86 domain-containing protein [Anoxybacillus voinovskiensis]MBB4075446.1 uncharacterized protein YutE (UPF0331/DUF86 family) [Anoxybacillus voinovskiensis]GGJ78749.1 UPF0331 protein YutE [Anoxybacillus voinovskiensis]
MYFVDRKKIEDTLCYMEKMLTLYEQQSSWNDEMTQLALERIVHVCIEAVLDVGNAMIDGFIMRDPGSYDDIIDILTDEKVVTEEDAKQLKAIIHYRKMLVQQYTTPNRVELLEAFRRSLQALQAYPKAIRTYLENELGPVSAFRN